MGSSVEASAIVVAANKLLQISDGVGMTVDQATGYDELQAACGRIGYCPRIRPLPLLAPTAFWPTYRRLWHARPSGPLSTPTTT